jgi:hypothetical protein
MRLFGEMRKTVPRVISRKDEPWHSYESFSFTMQNKKMALLITLSGTTLDDNTYSDEGESLPSHRARLFWMERG